MSYIILDNNMMWGRVKRMINASGKDVENRTGTTLKDLAREVVIAVNARSYATKLFDGSREEGKPEYPDMKIISDKSAAYLLRRVALNLAEEGKLFYYTVKMLDDKETCREMYGIINQIRLGNISKDADFDKRNGLKDLKLIHDAFLQKMEEGSYYDGAALICKAASYLDDEEFRQDFLQNLGTEESIEAFHINKISFMEEKLEKRLEVKPINFEGLLNFVSEAQSRNIHFYRAYGIENEIRYIIKKAREDKIPFGQIGICYSSAEYEGYIKAVLGGEGVPYAFVTGKKDNGGYITLMKKILTFVADGYNYEDYKQICRNPLMSGICYGIKLDKDYEIGWGSYTYLNMAERRLKDIEDRRSILEQAKAEFEAEQAKSKAEQQEAEAGEAAQEEEVKYPDLWKLERLDREKQYYEMMIALIKLFSDKKDDDKVELSTIYSTVVTFLINYTNKPNSERGKSLKRLKMLAEEIRDISSEMGKMKFRDALLFLDDYLEDIAATDAENSGAISVSRLGRVGVSERKTNFIVGLSFESFNVNTVDSPVMYDEEIRADIEAPISIAAEKNRERENVIRDMIGLMSGDIYLSYAYFNTVEMLDVSPSDIYMEYLKNAGLMLSDVPKIGFCLSSGDMTFEPQIDYTAIQDNKVNVEIQDAELSEIEDQETEADTESSDEEDIQRDKKRFAEFVPENMRDKLKLSYTSIGTMLECPKKFRYKYILHFNEEQTYRVDPYEWLPPNVKGTYAHEVLEKYLKAVQINSDGTIEADLNEAKLDEICDECYKNYLAQYPRHNDAVAQAREKEYRENLKNYLILQHNDFKTGGWKIFALEDVYLIEDIFKKQFKDPDGNALNLKINADARIDRIDYRQKADGSYEYRIVDYKSGTYKNTIDKVEKKSGRGKSADPAPLTVQHELYLRVLERIISDKMIDGIPDGDSKLFEYHFIYEEEADKKVYKIEKNDVIFDYMFDKIEEYLNGIPNVVDYTKNRCSYCGYKDLCMHALWVRNN